MSRELAVNAAARALVLATILLAVTTLSKAAVCTVSTPSVAFGSYSPLTGASRESIGGVDVTCSTLIVGTVSYAISLSAGTGPYAARQMASGAHSLGYNLFKDSARSLVWGDGTSGTSI